MEVVDREKAGRNWNNRIVLRVESQQNTFAYSVPRLFVIVVRSTKKTKTVRAGLLGKQLATA